MRTPTIGLLAAAIIFSTGLPAQQTATLSSVPRQVRVSNLFHPANGLAPSPVESATFSIYREEQGGTPLWSETQNVSVDAEGRYTAMLGSTLPEGVPADLFATGEPRWLGVRFNRPGELEQARVQLVSVPYALKAADAETLGGKPASAYMLDPNPPRPGPGGTMAAAPAASSASTTAAKLLKPRTITGTMNFLPIFTDNSNDIGNSVLYQSGAYIGLGTTTPLTPLHVITNGAGNQFLMRMQNVNSGGSANFQVYNDVGNRAQVGIYGSAQPSAGAVGTGEAYVYTSAPNLDLDAGAAGSSIKFMTGGTIEKARIDANGNVGLGTTTPAYRLDVAGDINLTGILRYQNSPVLRFEPSSPNIGLGSLSLQNNTTGTSNTGVGYSTLYGTLGGSYNTAVGGSALSSNQSGNYNTGLGSSALFNSTGDNNTALGYAALSNTTGSGNIAIGFNAGLNVTTGGNNIEIGNNGVSSDSGVIRLGATQISFFAAGIRGITTGSNDAIPVVIDSNGQLGTVSSSRRFKEDIHDMGDVSRGLMRLRPVTFRYKKPFADGSKPIQYGLIAEEVAEVYPDLVARSADGRIETVKYQVLTPMLLNELQRQGAEIDTQRAQIQMLQQQISELRSAIATLANGNLK